MDEVACVNHPDVTRHVQQCRTCGDDVCQDCRESQHTSGVPVIVCTRCADAARRRASMRRAGTVALVVGVLVTVAVAVQFSAAAAIVPLAFSAFWLAMMWRRYNSGTFTTRDSLWTALLLGRFFR